MWFSCRPCGIEHLNDRVMDMVNKCECVEWCVCVCVRARTSRWLWDAYRWTAAGPIIHGLHGRFYASIEQQNHLDDNHMNFIHSWLSARVCECLAPILMHSSHAKRGQRRIVYELENRSNEKRNCDITIEFNRRTFKTSSLHPQ